MGAPPPPWREGELPPPECPAAGACPYRAGAGAGRDGTRERALRMRAGVRLARRVEPGGR